MVLINPDAADKEKDQTGGSAVLGKLRWLWEHLWLHLYAIQQQTKPGWGAGEWLPGLGLSRGR